MGSSPRGTIHDAIMLLLVPFPHTSSIHRCFSLPTTWRSQDPSVGGTTCRKPYEMALMDFSCLSTPVWALAIFTEALMSYNLTDASAFENLYLEKWNCAVLFCKCSIFLNRDCYCFHGNPTVCIYILLQLSLDLTFKQALIKTWHF